MHYYWLKHVLFYLFIIVVESNRLLSENVNENQRSQLELRQRGNLGRRRLTIPGAESAGFSVFLQKAIPFAVPSNDFGEDFCFMIPSLKLALSGST
jgi:hypothetical protein